MTRSIVAIRGATGDGGGAGSVTRTTAIIREVIGDGDGDAFVRWYPVGGWRLPTAPGSSTQVIFTPATIETDHEQMSLAGIIDAEKYAYIESYVESADTEKKSSAFGAFRRLTRCDTDPVEIVPPDDFNPPFRNETVVPLGGSATYIKSDHYDLTIDLGLREPRPRDPIESAIDGEVVDEVPVELGAGETGEFTLTWTPDGSELGDATVTAAIQDESDSALVNVSGSPWTFSWSVGTLNLTNQRVGVPERTQTNGIPAVSIPLLLDAQQASTLLSVGSRVEATETRFLADAQNTVVDTLPGEELTCDVSMPTDVEFDDGTYVLDSWQLKLTRPASPRYDAEITLIRK